MLKELGCKLIKKYNLTESFYIADINKLKVKIQEWRNILPNVDIRYAIKCNPDEIILKTLINENIGFDAASVSEIDKVLNLGVNNNKIIYAHPIKSENDLKYAVSKKIKLTTFDSISELEKIKYNAPNINCLLRVKIDNPSAKVQLGIKYGASEDEYKSLIDAAKDMNIKLVGSAFHVGSFSQDPRVFKNGIEFASKVFSYAKEKGYMMNILDIGGGFIGSNFNECGKIIKNTIKEEFSPDIKIIAEPGRYFAEEIFTFFIPVLGQRKRENYEYYVGDSLYGSLNCVLYDNQKLNFEVVRNPLLKKYIDSDEKMNSVMHFITCDSYDTYGKIDLPYLRNKDYLMIPNLGAYSLAGSCNFNGINFMNPKIFYI